MERDTSTLHFPLGTRLFSSTEQPFSQSLASFGVNFTAEAERAEGAQRNTSWKTNTAVFGSVAATAVSIVSGAEG